MVAASLKSFQRYSIDPIGSRPEFFRDPATVTPLKIAR
jgi:hypothetical protein